VRILVATVAAVVTAAWSVPGSAQTVNPPECRPFVVETRVENIRFVEIDPVGKSLGDYRVGINGLYDPDGVRIGTTYFRSTIMQSPETGADMVLATLIHAFANGTIAASALARLDDAEDESRSTTVTTYQAITGGTQAFSGAHGSATVSNSDAGTRTIAFDIACD
jgi:hypothetical protein